VIQNEGSWNFIYFQASFCDAQSNMLWNVVKFHTVPA